LVKQRSVQRNTEGNGEPAGEGGGYGTDLREEETLGDLKEGGRRAMGLGTSPGDLESGSTEEE
jgi:hypothetical protein